MGSSPTVCCLSLLARAKLTLPSQVRDELNHEALQFVKEQRIRCLLQGAWFPMGIDYVTSAGPVTSKTLNRSVPSAWRFVRLSHNRRYLHYADFDEKTATEPRLDTLQEKSTCNARTRRPWFALLLWLTYMYS
jgi:engulfment/cell motility protein 1